MIGLLTLINLSNLSFFDSFKSEFMFVALFKSFPTKFKKKLKLLVCNNEKNNY